MIKEFLDDTQSEAIKNMFPGCMLVGDVGSGKTRTAIAYYYLKIGHGELTKFGSMKTPVPLYIITTAATRDKRSWDQELSIFGLSKNGPDNVCQVPVVIDSWNNIEKYTNVKDAFFIFDEQKTSTFGKWSKCFLKITNNNLWIMLTATPGDNYTDFAVFFVANHLYKNITEFRMEHEITNPHVTYRSVIGYRNQKKLEYYINKYSIRMERDPNRAVHKDQKIVVGYDEDALKKCAQTGINPFTLDLIEDGQGYYSAWRRIINSSPYRIEAVARIMIDHPKVIIFYNYNYELEILKNYCYQNKIPYAEWNGFKHEPIPTNEDQWCYLIQYNAGAEGWNCRETDTIIFYSLNYSYKVTKQAAGRIDRRNSPFNILYYYTIVSDSIVDRRIDTALKKKQNFNENRYFEEIKASLTQ